MDSGNIEFISVSAVFLFVGVRVEACKIFTLVYTRSDYVRMGKCLKFVSKVWSSIYREKTEKRNPFFAEKGF